MSQKFLVFVLLSVVLLAGCSNGTDSFSFQDGEYPFASEIALMDKPGFSLGSMEYVSMIDELSMKSGSKTALYKIMFDVDKYGTELDNAGYDSLLRLYKLVSGLVGQVGHVDQRTHYFRNKLNRTPENLETLLKQNSSLPPSGQWILLSAGSSYYHMQGELGIYNLKYISADGFCEAVYNMEGALLDDETDPVNMGTFNYGAGISGLGAHHKYDISPYLQWGNTQDSPQKGKAKIERSIKRVVKSYKDHSESVLEYRANIINRILNPSL